jgi:hypothetical protein
VIDLIPSSQFYRDKKMTIIWSFRGVLLMYVLLFGSSIQARNVSINFAKKITEECERWSDTIHINIPTTKYKWLTCSCFTRQSTYFDSGQSLLNTLNKFEYGATTQLIQVKPHPAQEPDFFQPSFANLFPVR